MKKRPKTSFLSSQAWRKQKSRFWQWILGQLVVVEPPD